MTTPDRWWIACAGPSSGAFNFCATRKITTVIGNSPGAWPLCARAEETPRGLVGRVRRGGEGGVQFLRDQENHNGNWELDGGLASMRPGGETSLVMLALLNAGVKPDDPIIERGLKFLRTVDPRDTYVVGLQTMVFAAAGKAVDFPLIQRNVQWLIDSRVMDGKELYGWTYMKGGDPKLNIAGISANSNTQYALL